MCLEDCNNFSIIYQTYFVYWIIIVLPLLLILAPMDLTCASYEFQAFKMVQYDAEGLPRGCQSLAVSLEARPFSQLGSSKHCTIMLAIHLTVRKFKSICEESGALIMVLPKNLLELSLEEKEHILSLEKILTNEKHVSIPIYFVHWSKEWQLILDEMDRPFYFADRQMSYVIRTVFDSSYQVTIMPTLISSKSEPKFATIQGKLTGSYSEKNSPTIAVVAHYDSSGIASELAFGAESNASGVAMLLELARLFSLVYSKSSMQPKINLLFVVTAAGKLNYFGSKKWIEEQYDNIDGITLQDIVYIICLDSLSSSENLYLHVSKPPRENSSGTFFYNDINTVSKNLRGSAIEGIHKKINLADERLSWEHERYSLRKMQAATLSTLKDPETPSRRSILDFHKESQNSILHKHANIVAEALVRHMQNVSESMICAESLNVSTENLSMWQKYLSSQSRDAFLLSDSGNPIIHTIKMAFKKYLDKSKIFVHFHDKNEENLNLCGATKVAITIYNVKPAVFDLFLTSVIILYLSIVYFCVQNFYHVYNLNTL